MLFCGSLCKVALSFPPSLMPPYSLLHPPFYPTHLHTLAFPEDEKDKDKDKKDKDEILSLIHI